MRILFYLLTSLGISASMQVDFGDNSFSYEVTKYGECRSDTNRLRIFLSISVADCVKECWTRPSCVALSYTRRLNLCEIFGTENGASFAKGWCVYVTRTSIRGIQTPCQTCGVGETCDTHSNTCMKKECEIPRLANGEIFGNKRNIGARIVYRCTKGLIIEENDIRGATCLESATWSHTAECTLVGVVFRIIAGIGIDTVEAWTTGSGTTSDITCGIVQNSDCTFHYRDPMIDNWEQLNPLKVRYSIYKDGSEVAWVLFDGTGTDMTNWFHQDRVISSSYDDITSSSTFNYFAIDPEVWFSPRHFYISVLWNGCSGDVVHHVILDGADVCSYGQASSYPLIFYSTATNAIKTSRTDLFGYADSVTVTVIS